MGGYTAADARTRARLVVRRRSGGGTDDVRVDGRWTRVMRYQRLLRMFQGVQNGTRGFHTLNRTDTYDLGCLSLASHLCVSSIHANE